jgi:hypothetical protein
VVAAGCVVALAACGSAAKPAPTESTSYASAVRFSQCMRSHGVPNLPDPVPGTDGGKVAIPVSSAVNPQSPAFEAAQRSCQRLLPGGGPPPNIPESVKLTALKLARCMRAHGVPDYPDPLTQRSTAT